MYTLLIIDITNVYSIADRLQETFGPLPLACNSGKLMFSILYLYDASQILHSINIDELCYISRKYCKPIYFIKFAVEAIQVSFRKEIIF